MKKNFKWLLLIAVLLLQSTVNIYGQGGSHQLNISVAGIEYDDANFTKLKESIKTNKKAHDVKQSFSQNTAKLSLSYSGDATELWDDLSTAIKQPFKIITIENDHIDLQLKNSPAGSPGSTTKSSSNTNTSNNDDCKNCYWNICNYDVLKSFGGKIYKGITEDDATHYYNCDNGVLLHKIVTVNANGVITSINTDTLLISGGPIGTRWGAINQDIGNGLLSIMSNMDLSMKNSGAYTLIAKNVTTEVNGKTYKDAIVINYRGFSKDPLFGNNFYNSNYYYARSVGLIKTDSLNFDSDPVSAINKPSDTKAVYSNNSVVKEGIDASILGLWKNHDASTNKDIYYRFNADGTFECYENSVTEANKVKGIHKWKIEEGGYNKQGVAIIDMAWAGGGNYVMRCDLEKKNDQATGKPALLLRSALLVAVESKKPW